jgi:MFS family permease
MERPAPLDTLRPSQQCTANRRPIVAGQSISLFGDYIAYFTLPWLVFELTGRGSDLGLAAFSETIPVLLFGFAVGVVLDRLRMRRALIFADLVRTAIFGLLAIAVVTGTIAPWHVFVAAFGFGTMTVLFDAGLQAMLPSVIDSGSLVDVNANLSLARTISFALGPAIAGIIIAGPGGFEAALILNAATFIVSALLLFRVKEIRPRTARPRYTSFTTAVGRGLRFLFREPHLRWATIGAAAANLVFAPLEALLVLFVESQLAGSVMPPEWLDFLFTGAAEVGLFIGIQAAIGSVGIVLAPRFARRIGLGRMYVLGIAMLGLGFAGVTALRSFLAVIPAGIGVAGVGWVNVAFVTMRQQITPAPLLGRVTAASRTLAYVAIPFGAALGGFLADSLGIVPVYLVGSIATMVVAILLSFTPLWWRPIPDAPSTDWSTEAMQTMGIRPAGPTNRVRPTVPTSVPRPSSDLPSR